MYNPTKIAETLSQFEKRFHEENPDGLYLKSLFEFCCALRPLLPPYISIVITDLKKVTVCFWGDDLRLSLTEGEDIGDQWRIREVIENKRAISYVSAAHGVEYGHIGLPLHNNRGEAIGSFHCFYQQDPTSFLLSIQETKQETVHAIVTRMKKEIIFSYLAERLYQLIRAHHIQITTRNLQDNSFNVISEFAVDKNGSFLEKEIRADGKHASRIYQTIISTAQTLIQRNDKGSGGNSPVINDAVKTLMVVPIVSKDEVIGSINLGFPEEAWHNKRYVTAVEELASYLSLVVEFAEISQKDYETIPDARYREKGLKRPSDAVSGLAFELKDKLFQIALQLFDLYDKSPENVKVWMPVIAHIEDMALGIQNVLKERLDDEPLNSEAVSLPDLIGEFILQTEEKMLKSEQQGNTVLVNEIKSSEAVEVNKANMTAILQHVLRKMMKNMPSHIYFQNRHENGRLYLEIRTSQQSYAGIWKDKPQDTEADQRLLRLLLELNGIPMRYFRTSDNHCGYRLLFPINDLKSATVAPALMTTESKSSRSWQVLIVDDDDALRDLMVDILASRNYNIVCCADAGHALTEFKMKPYDLVITDYSLPGKSGLDLASEIKKIRQETPVVMVTGWGSELESIKEGRKNIDYVLSKPFNLADLLSAVEGSIKTA